MKKFAFILSILSTTTLWAQNTVYDYVKRYKNVAVEEMERTGIPASIILGQGILESTFGNSKLALLANNHFSIPCSEEWNGEYYYKWTGKQMPSCFKVYDSPEQSFFEHTDYISNDNKFRNLFSLERRDYKKWAKGLEKNKYSDISNYSHELIDVIEEFQLSKYDKTEKEEKNIPVAYNTKEKHHYLKNNGVKAVVVRSDDTPLIIALKYDIPVNKLLSYNELSSVDDKLQSQFVYLKPKRSQYRGPKDFHYVKRNENMHIIAQFYGVKLQSLLKLNLLEENEMPAVGEKVYLRKKAPIKPKLVSKNPIIASVPNKPTSKPKVSTAIPGKPATTPSKTNTTAPKPVATVPGRVPTRQPQEALPGKPITANKPIQKPAIATTRPVPGKPNTTSTTTTPSKKPLKPRVRVKVPSNDVTPSMTPPGGAPPKKPAVLPTTPEPEKETKVYVYPDNPQYIIPGRTKPEERNNELNPPGLVTRLDSGTVVEIEKAKPSNDGKIYHEIQKGENLYRIALRYKTTVEQLKKWNNLTSSTINRGAFLIVGEE